MTDTAKSSFFLVFWFLWSRQKKNHFVMEQEKKRDWHWVEDEEIKAGWGGSEMMALADCIQFKSSPSAISIFISQPRFGSVWVVSSGLSETNLRPWRVLTRRGPAFQTKRPPKILVFRRNKWSLWTWCFLILHRWSANWAACSYMCLCVCVCACTNIFLLSAPVFSTDSPP